MKKTVFFLLPVIVVCFACREPKAPQPKEAGAAENQQALPSPAPTIQLASIAANTEEAAKPADFTGLAGEYNRFISQITNDSIRTMLQNQVQILQQPANPQIKREVMEKQFSGTEVFAAGVGKPNPRMNAAQNRAGTSRAAAQDAVRWLAYFKYWQENNFKKSFGALPDIAVPGFETVRTECLPDGGCTALVKTKL
jgi:hypothetical protein